MTTRPTPPPGTSGCVCPACWELFNSPTPFGAHQRLTDDGVQCRDPSEVGLVVIRKHQGRPVWGKPRVGDGPAARRTHTQDH